jgi:flagellar basal-body rod protein FlgF
MKGLWMRWSYPETGLKMTVTNLVLLSDQMALQRSVDIVANNIANSSTTGFKREGIQFETYLSHGAATKSTSYVYDRATFKDNSAGPVTPTGNPLDLAITGKGYFQIQSRAGQLEYTRDGALRTDPDGNLTTSTGLKVMSDSGQPVQLPEGSIDVTISGDGFITAQVGTSTSRTQLGKVGVFTFDNDQAVTPASDGLLTTTQTPTPALGSNLIVQGSIEGSNVQPITEMTDLIQIQRAYEQASNLISNENQRLSDAYDKLSQAS